MQLCAYVWPALRAVFPYPTLHCASLFSHFIFFFFSRNHHASFRLMHFELFWSSRSMPMFLFPSSLGTQHISHIPLIFNNFFFRACVAFLFLKSLASFFPPFLKSKKRFYRQLFSLFLSPSCSILWFLSTCTCRF